MADEKDLEKEKKDQDKDKSSSSKSGLIAAIPIVLALVTMTGAQIKECNAERAALLRRADDYRIAYEDQKERHREAAIKILDMTYQLKHNFDRLAIIQRYIDSFPLPMWIKEYNPDRNEFRMLMINRAYEQRFNVSRDRYVGLTDFQLWPEEIAAEYFRHDLKVYEEKNTMKKDETVLMDGKKMQSRIWKFSVRLPFDQFGVGGIVVD